MTTTTMGSAGAGELRNRLATCNLADLGGKDWFLLRLQRETGWSRTFALGAITEYLRFCELCVRSGGESTSPGPIIDQVWHLHLLETRHYWDIFCPHVLGQPLHHAPARPGLAEVALGKARHARTLDRYRRLFGTVAPAGYWPDWPASPPSSAAARQHWPAMTGRDCLLALLLPASTAAAGLLAPADPGRWDLGGMLGWLLLTCLAMSSWAWRRALREPGRCLDPATMDPVALAFATSGRWRAFDTAMTELLVAGHVQLEVSAGLAQARGDPSASRLSPWSLTLWQSLRRSGASPLAGLDRVMLDRWAELERSLRRQGLVHSAEAERSRQWLRVPLLLWILVLLPHVFARHFQVGSVLLLLASILGCVLIGRRLGATDHMRARIRAQRERGGATATGAGDDLPRAVALHSTRAFARHPLLADYVHLRRQQIAQREAETSYGVEIGCSDHLACSGGDGGGDADGGCSGCGGD